MNGENATIISWLVQWLQDWGILVLAAVAFFAPYFVRLWYRKYIRPKLDIEFKDEVPYCHHAKTKGGLRPYYCHFVVVNSGRSQADDCEAVLERIWDSGGEKDDLEWQERKNFVPVNLKWSAEDPKENFERACFKTIYPGGRKYFCDIGRVNQREDEDKFFFELPRVLIVQERYLSFGKYKIQISVYSKNAAKVTREFVVDWRGGWREKQEEMQKRLRIKMLLGEKD